MSKISLEPNDSGAGTFTLAAPNSNTNRTLNLPDESGTIFSDGSGVPGSAVTGQLASSNMPAGSVIQVVSTTKTDTFVASVPGEGSVDITGLSVDITPTNSTSKVLILLSVAGHNNVEAGVHYNVKRDGAFVALPDGSSSYEPALGGHIGLGNTEITASSSASIMDFPSTTSSTNYQVAIVTVTGATRTHYINRAASLGRNFLVSTITAMEIAG